MLSLNRVTLTGPLGKDPETTPAGDTTATKFSIAVNEEWKDDAGEKQKRVNWFQVVVWNGNGENVALHLKKGSHVAIDGSLRSSEWNDKESGQKRFGVEIVANRVLFLDKKGEDKKKRK
jgi:single-strand DNA-binding protein